VRVADAVADVGRQNGEGPLGQIKAGVSIESLAADIARRGLLQGHQAP